MATSAKAEWKRRSAEPQAFKPKRRQKSNTNAECHDGATFAVVDQTYLSDGRTRATIECCWRFCALLPRATL
jgi:hypothetical protein